jgi:hypothetical protein
MPTLRNHEAWGSRVVLVPTAIKPRPAPTRVGTALSPVHAAQFYRAADSISQSFVIPTEGRNLLSCGKPFKFRRHPERSRLSGGVKDLARTATALHGDLCASGITTAREKVQGVMPLGHVCHGKRATPSRRRKIQPKSRTAAQLEVRTLYKKRKG